MPNIASVLKEEIARLARKELRSSTESMKKAVSNYRSEIASLKRRMALLERQVRRGPKASMAIAATDGPGSSRTRWSAKGFAKHRAGLGLSASDYAKLLGVSSLSVYKWENGKVRPSARYLPAIAVVRSLGKREAASRLEQLAS